MKKAYNLGMTLLLLAAGILYGPMRMGERILAGMASGELGQLTADRFDALMRGITFCHQAAAMSLVIFAVRLAMTLLEGRKRVLGKQLSSGAEGRLGQFLDSQGERMRQWSANCREARDRTIYYTGLLIVGALILAWNRSRTPIQFLFVIMLPFALRLAEGLCVLMWVVQRISDRPGSMMKKLTRSLEKELKDGNAREAFAADLCEAGEEWMFQEITKKSVTWGILGTRYWVKMDAQTKRAEVVDTVRLSRIALAVSGNTNSLTYKVRFYYKDSPKPKYPDQTFSFEEVKNRSHFLELAKARLEDRIPIVEEE